MIYSPFTGMLPGMRNLIVAAVAVAFCLVVASLYLTVGEALYGLALLSVFWLFAWVVMSISLRNLR